MDNNGAFLTTYRDDYRNPYSQSIIKKAPKPPEWTRNNEDFLYSRDCDTHSTLVQPKPIDFDCGGENLLEKERQNVKINSRGLHENDCPLTDDVMRSLKYSNKDYPVIHCRVLKTDNCDCPLKNAQDNPYRDPHPFRLFAVETAPNYRSPTDDICSGPSFFSRKDTLGISEYKDTISKTGQKTMLAVQQYREPTPSSRRRLDGQCVQTF